jgi:hypothetical protein
MGSKPKLAAIIRSYHLTDFLADAIRQFSWIEKVLVVNCRYEGYTRAKDDTEEIVKELNQENVELLKLKPMKEHEVLNTALEHLEGYDLVYICDSDEFISREDQEKLTTLTIQDGNFPYDAGLCQIADIYPDKLETREHCPIMIVKPHVRFYNQRCAGGEHKYFNVEVLHFGPLVKARKWKANNYKRMNMTSEIKEMEKIEDFYAGK